MNANLLQEIEKGTRGALIKKNIINYYIQNGSSTINELSKELDLSIPSVNKIITEMCEDGYIDTYGKLETSGGRYPSLFGLNPHSAYFIGVDIKQFGINIGIINFKGDMLEMSTDIPYQLDNTPEALDRLCKIILSFIEKQNIDKTKILNININISGRVNRESGYSYSIFYFEERPLTEILSEKLQGHKVSIDNDTRAMTYGEFLAGSVKNEKNVIFVNLSWGLAIGIIIDGKIYAGKSGFAGEFGHVKAYDNEIICHCGKKGCLETEASGRAMLRKLYEAIQNGASSRLSKKVVNKETVMLDDILKSVLKEDVLCIELIEEVGQKLGEQLAGIINIFNPEMVVIGGTASVTEDYIMQPIISAIRKYSLNLANKDTSVVISALKDKAGLIGACLMARARLFE